MKKSEKISIKDFFSTKILRKIQIRKRLRLNLISIFLKIEKIYRQMVDFTYFIKVSGNVFFVRHNIVQIKNFFVLLYCGNKDS